MANAFCFRCHAVVSMENAKAVTLKNGRSALQGTCPKCGTKLSKIVRT